MPEPETYDETYELFPEKEIQELKQELQKLKSFDVTPSKSMQVSMVELNQKLDKLLHIFDDALDKLKVEEGKDLLSRMDKLEEQLDEVLEQNKTIAEGLVAITDMIKPKPAPFPRPMPGIPTGVPGPPGMPRPPMPPVPRR